MNDLDNGRLIECLGVERSYFVAEEHMTGPEEKQSCRSNTSYKHQTIQFPHL